MQTKRNMIGLIAVAALCLAVLTTSACTRNPSDPSADTKEESSSVGETSADTTPETSSEEEPTLLVSKIVPTPIEMSIPAGERAVGLCPERFTLAEEDMAFAHLLTEAGATLGEGGFPVSVTYRDLSGDFAYGTDEAYILSISEEGVTIEAQTERGAFYGMTTLCFLYEYYFGYIPVITIQDAPRNAQRGVIEGFYGTAYTHEFRKELFAFMGANKMNAYIYAPKDDAKHRAQWRDLYEGDELTIMTDLIETAHQNYVKFIYAISPGMDIDLGAGYEADFERLMAKCQQIYDMGARDFAIFLDDIPTLDAVGHAKLLNDFQTRFVETHEGVSNLVAITTEYTDWMLTDYTDTLAPLIHEDIELMWTGPNVSPEKINKNHLRAINRKYGREVFIWWNYPVNDILVNNLYMGPCQGLASNLHEAISGLVANPMNQGYASMVPLMTTADYLWNPEAYDENASLRRACELLAIDVSGALENFISMTCSSPMNKYTDSAQLKMVLDAHGGIYSGDAASALRDYCDMMVTNADRLAKMKNQALYADIAEWVDKYRAYGVMGRAYGDMEIAYAEGADRNTILALMAEYVAAERSIQGNERLVSTSVLTPLFASISDRLNELCGIRGESTVSLPSVTTNLPTYDCYPPELACDGVANTFFWSGRGGMVGDTIQLDLGTAVAVSRVTFRARGGSGEMDYVHNGELSYSVDGENWITLCAVSQPVVELDANVTARYFRVEVLADQINWITLSEFSADTEDLVPASVALDEYVIPRYYLISLVDHRVNTALIPEGAAVGHSLLVTVGDTGSVTILCTGLPEDGCQAILRGSGGEEIGRVALQYETVITAPAGTVISIPLENGLRIAELW